MNAFELVGNASEKVENASTKIQNAICTYSRITRWPRRRRWACCVDTDPSSQTRVERGRTFRGAGRNSAGRSSLLVGLRKERGGRPGEELQSVGSNEHAVAHGALEVAVVLDAAIVLAGRVVELDADPEAGGELGLAREANDAGALVGQLDLAALVQLGLRHVIKDGYLMLRHDRVGLQLTGRSAN